MVLVTKAKRTPAIQHKKRSGQHHKQSKHYIKPYWPYLPLIGIVSLGVLLNGAWTSHMHGVLGYATNVSATQLLADTNTQRTDNHEQALQLNNQLTAAAEAKATDMAQHNYWSHDTPDGRTPWSFMTAAGYQFAAAGENLAYGFNSSEDIMNGWMNSPEHRTNVLNKVFTQVGFGIANATNYQGHGPQTIVVAMYGEPATVASIANAPGGTNTMPATVVSEPQSTQVPRVQAISMANSWDVFAIYTVVSIGVLWFVIRHGLFARRALVMSEEFIIHHPFLDIAIVSVATAGVLLTRTAGFIH